MSGPLKVHALVGLLLHPAAGGHVKCWQRFAEAAAERGDPGIDLTVHFLGETARVEALSPFVRLQTHRPAFLTRRCPWLRDVPDHTDLAPWHPALARALLNADVIHATDTDFAFARTGQRLARRLGCGFTLSLHTDTAAYARIFTGPVVERLFGRASAITRFLVERVRLPERYEQIMLARKERYCATVDAVLGPPPAGALAGHSPGTLRRGVDWRIFSPARRDRAWLDARFGIEPGSLALVFVGRINRGKNVAVLADAVARNRAAGAPVTLILAGAGEDAQQIRAQLGPGAVLAGTLDQATLGRVYASADALAFPSMVEIYSNVVVEGLAAGLPVLLAEENSMAARLGLDGAAYSLTGADAGVWAGAIRTLADDRTELARLTAAARALADRLPGWTTVLAEDLIPVWREAAARHGRDVR